MHADEYARRGHRRVEGWLSDGAALQVLALAREQERRGVAGAVAEVGVHHGRLFLLLHLLRRPAEGSLAIDLFGDQEQNVDHSGMGDLEAFRHNLRSVGADPAEVQVVQGSSMDVTPAQVLEAVGPVRIFSVDGGHTAELTRNDLTLAEGALARGGIVVLDDAFNGLWPGVMSGLVEFLSAGTDLVPFGIGHNKLHLARLEDADAYRAVLAASDLHRATSMFLGHTVEVLGHPPAAVRRVATAAYRRLAESPGVGSVVEGLKPAVKRLLR